MESEVSIDQPGFMEGKGFDACRLPTLPPKVLREAQGESPAPVSSRSVDGRVELQRVPSWVSGERRQAGIVEVTHWGDFDPLRVAAQLVPSLRTVLYQSQDSVPSRPDALPIRRLCIRGYGWVAAKLGSPLPSPEWATPLTWRPDALEQLETALREAVRVVNWGRVRREQAETPHGSTAPCPRQTTTALWLGHWMDSTTNYDPTPIVRAILGQFGSDAEVIWVSVEGRLVVAVQRGLDVVLLRPVLADTEGNWLPRSRVIRNIAWALANQGFENPDAGAPPIPWILYPKTPERVAPLLLPPGFTRAEVVVEEDVWVLSAVYGSRQYVRPLCHSPLVEITDESFWLATEEALSAVQAGAEAQSTEYVPRVNAAGDFWVEAVTTSRTIDFAEFGRVSFGAQDAPERDPLLASGGGSYMPTGYSSDLSSAVSAAMAASQAADVAKLEAAVENETRGAIRQLLACYPDDLVVSGDTGVLYYAKPRRVAFVALGGVYTVTSRDGRVVTTRNVEEAIGVLAEYIQVTGRIELEQQWTRYSDQTRQGSSPPERSVTQTILAETQEGLSIGAALAMNRKAAQFAATQMGVSDNQIAELGIQLVGPLLLRSLAFTASQADATQLASLLGQAASTSQKAVGVEMGLRAADLVLDTIVPLVVAYVREVAGEAAASLVTPELVTKMLGMEPEFEPNPTSTPKDAVLPEQGGRRKDDR